jgi:hypothetical protein
MSSWALFGKKDKKDKSGMGDLTVFDPSINKKLYQQLNPNIVIIALNVSENIDKRPDFSNFHVEGKGYDFKMRYAFNGTILSGAYMTDIIKNFVGKNSKDTMKKLKEKPVLEKENIEIFTREIKDLGVSNPILIACGYDVERILKRNLNLLKKSFKSVSIIRIIHYSHQIGKGEYKKRVDEKIKMIEKMLKIRNGAFIYNKIKEIKN